jgi:hypothetical protein
VEYPAGILDDLPLLMHRGARVGLSRLERVPGVARSFGISRRKNFISWFRHKRQKPMTPNSEWHWEQGIKYAIEGIKTGLLLNGAAAIALMTFANTHPVTGGVKCAIFSFALGATVAAFAFIAAYKTQLEYGNALIPGISNKDEVWRKGQWWNHIAVYSVVTSVVMFAIGCGIVLWSWPTA